jgi:hypothetical protein
MKVNKKVIGLLIAALVLGLSGAFCADAGNYKNVAEVLQGAAVIALCVALYAFYFDSD